MKKTHENYQIMIEANNDIHDGVEELTEHLSALHEDFKELFADYKVAHPYIKAQHALKEAMNELTSFHMALIMAQQEANE